MMYVLQEELKHKLSEENKLITEYEVSSPVFADERESKLKCKNASVCFVATAAARQERQSSAAATAEAGRSTTASAGGHPWKGR